MSASPGQSSAAIALFLPSLEGGGAERVFVELANEFARVGHRTDLVLASARGPYLGEVSRDVRVVDLGAPRVLGALPRLVRYLRANRPRALLSALDHANVVAVLASRLAGGRTRSVISMRAMPSEIYRPEGAGGSRFLFRCMKVAYPRADAIIANSRAVALDLSQVLALPVDTVPVIHNPLNLARLDELAREDAPHPWLSDGGPPIVLSVGALAPLKDFATLVRALRSRARAAHAGSQSWARGRSASTWPQSQRSRAWRSTWRCRDSCRTRFHGCAARASSSAPPRLKAARTP